MTYKPMTDEEIIQKASDIYAIPSNDDIEIDDDAKLSRADNGTWVTAWVWVPFDKIEEEAE